MACPWKEWSASDVPVPDPGRGIDKIRLAGLPCEWVNRILLRAGIFKNLETSMTVVERSGLLVVLSSPSGAGKSTLSRKLLREQSEFELSVSATTRPARPGEVEGTDYFFVSDQRFEEIISDNGMLEHAQVFGNRYGTPREPVEAAMNRGKDVLFDVDWQGAQQLRASSLGHAVVQIFILPPSIEALANRLIARAQDSSEMIAERMAKAKSEISHWAEYDYVIVNDDLGVAEKELFIILAAERMKRARQSGLTSFVSELTKD